MKRRTFLKSSGTVLAAGLGVAAVVGLNRGLRFPTLQFEPAWAAESGELSSVASVIAKSATLIPTATLSQLQGQQALRASGPQPQLELEIKQSGVLDFEIQNISPRAQFDASSSKLDERGSGLTRRVSGTVSAGDTLQLQWRMPDENNYRIAMIGDSGGGLELEWCIQRAAALGAEFMLHLGDVYYEPNDVVTAPKVLNAAACPVFMSIGNHDFHKGFNRLHEDFTNAIGPRNSSFRLGDIRFINFDTAAGTFPPSRGERSSLLRAMTGEALSTKAAAKVVYYTHMPLTDPRQEQDPDHTHNVPEREQPWLREQLKAGRGDILIAGHVHLSKELDDDGIQTYIAGEGMAHRDVLAGRQIAKLLIADVSNGKDMDFRWEPLLMPSDIHCNGRVLRIMREAEHSQNPAEFCRLLDS